MGNVLIILNAQYCGLALGKSRRACQIHAVTLFDMLIFDH